MFVILCTAVSINRCARSHTSAVSNVRQSFKLKLQAAFTEMGLPWHVPLVAVGSCSFRLFFYQFGVIQGWFILFCDFKRPWNEQTSVMKILFKTQSVSSLGTFMVLEFFRQVLSCLSGSKVIKKKKKKTKDLKIRNTGLGFLVPWFVFFCCCFVFKPMGGRSGAAIFHFTSALIIGAQSLIIIFLCE